MQSSVSSSYSDFAALRLKAPCFWDAAAKCYVVMNHGDAQEILRRPEHFSNLLRREADGSNVSAAILIGQDPPAHTRVRSLVQRFFTTKRLEGLRPWIESTTNELLSEMGHGDVDVVPNFTEALPVMAIARLLGIDVPDWRTFKRWSTAAMTSVKLDSRRSSLRDVQMMYRYFTKEIQNRRKTEQEGLISEMMRSEHGSEGLTDIEVLQMCTLFLTAGSETTTHLIGNALHIMAQLPDLWTRLRNGSVKAAQIVEEALRYDSPIQLLRRVTTYNTQVNALSFKTGDVVTVCLGAANRDPAVFANPDEFMVERDFTRHLAFGQGIHFCLGFTLSRMEAETALSQLASRYSKIESAGFAKRVDSFAMSGFQSLPLRLTI